MAGYSPITIARFWSKVKVERSSDECWNWTASTKELGYGRVKIDGKVYTASRVAWELANGEPLGDRHALHTCDNPTCCNPNHIMAGDHAENMLQAKERGLLVRPDFSGEANPRAKLTESDVAEIRELIAGGRTNKDIARRFGVTHSMISRIRTGRSWNRTDTDQNKTLGSRRGIA